MEERRREPRVLERMEIKEINRQAGEDSFVLDHNSLGAMLETSLSLAPGEAVEFSYQRPGEEQETRRWGQVIWVLPVPDQPGRCRLGVEFFLHEQ